MKIYLFKTANSYSIIFSKVVEGRGSNQLNILRVLPDGRKMPNAKKEILMVAKEVLDGYPDVGSINEFDDTEPYTTEIVNL